MAVRSKSVTHDPASLSSLLRSLPATERTKILAGLSERECAALLYDWELWARPNQLAPDGSWTTWLFLAGRGTGKTRSGAENVRSRVESGKAGRVALIGPTAADTRDVMVEGESGVLAISPPWNRPKYEPSKRRLTWPNGAIATTYSADEPERLRGPQHDFGWCDEPASWRYPDAWDMFMFGLRIGEDPRVVVTGTPKPVRLIRDLIAREGRDVVITRGTTYENRDNLAPAFLEQIIQQYEGTRIGRQELLGEVLEDVEGALVQRDLIEQHRVREAPDMVRIVVSIDPAATSHEGSDHTGLCVTGIGSDSHLYVLHSEGIRATPRRWAYRAWELFDLWQADTMIYESNQGGDMVREVLMTVRSDVRPKAVHASRGKHTRAEPIASLFEQGKVHMVGSFPVLEDQWCQWVPGDPSPDQLDASVWGLTELVQRGVRRKIRVSSRQRA